MKLLNVIAGDWWTEIRLWLESERERERVLSGGNRFEKCEGERRDLGQDHRDTSIGFCGFGDRDLGYNTDGGKPRNLGFRSCMKVEVAVLGFPS